MVYVRQPREVLDYALKAVNLVIMAQTAEDRVSVKRTYVPSVSLVVAMATACPPVCLTVWTPITALTVRTAPADARPATGSLVLVKSVTLHIRALTVSIQDCVKPDVRRDVDVKLVAISVWRCAVVIADLNPT